jgi:hypothetical protein
MSAPLRPSSFTPHVGTAFALTDEGGPLDLVLDRVDVLPSAPGQRQFSLVFVAPTIPVHGQRTYHVTHDALGDLDLFLVPIGHVEGGIELEACFNQLVPVD